MNNVIMGPKTEASFLSVSRATTKLFKNIHTMIQVQHLEHVLFDASLGGTINSV